jgi:5-enolpyruvylshikimate-3-phosphate synthase
MEEEGKDEKVVASSQAKRRLEAMATSIDHRLAAVFTVVLLISKTKALQRPSCIP